MKQITPLATVDAVIKVPGSKSITQRAMICAALANGESTMFGPLASEDTKYTASALRAMGIDIVEEKDRWIVSGRAGRIVEPVKDIYLGNNGTATRFLTSVAALGHGRFVIAGDKRMAERPIQPLMEALRGWGVDIRSINDTGCPPLEINAAGLAGGRTLLPEGKSSQYLSSLLLVAPYARKPGRLDVAGEGLSRPYGEMTTAVMADFGVRIAAARDCSRFEIEPGCYQARDYRIEGDASNASYFWAAAAVTGGRVTVSNVPVPSLQGDALFVALLARMGCEVEQSGNGITLQGPKELQGIEIDMAAWPDVVPTLAAKLGARVEEREDSLIIEGIDSGGPALHGAEIETHNDHRIAMSFAVAGLKVDGIMIKGEECVAKSFPDFWERFQRLYPD